MKITVWQKNLKQGLFATSYITGRNTNLQILNNVLIKAEANAIKLISTDLDLGVVSHIRGKVEVEGSLTVNAKILANFINLLPNKTINLSVDNNSLAVTGDNYQTKIKGESADDYPLLPEINEQERVNLDINEFKEAMAAVLFSASNDDSRPALTGVVFYCQEDDLVMAATDSYRLAEKKIKLLKKTEGLSDRKIIIPLKTLQELNRILIGDYTDEQQTAVDIVMADNQISFLFDNITIISRLIDEQYPDYQQIVPKNFTTTAILDKEEFQRSVKAAAIFSKTGVNDIEITFTANQATIFSSSGQVGENSGQLEAKIEGADISISLNYRYLLDGLNAIKSKTIEFKLADNTPCLLKATDKSDYFYIIMPIKK